MAKKKKARKIAIISSIAVVLCAGGTIGFTAYAKSKSSDTTTVFRTSQAETGNIDVTVTGSGTISDSTEYTLTATNAGTIDSLPVKQGDTVTAGQTIAHVGNTNSQQTILQKQNALATAKNNLAQSEQNLNSLTIKAPIAGKVKSVIASAGDDLSTIKALGNLAVISTERSMTVSVSSSSSLKTGDTVRVTDTSTNKTYTGTVTASGSTGSTSGSSRTSSDTSGSGSSGSYGNVTITIGTDDPKVGDTVNVTTAGGDTVGTGTLALSKYVAISSNSSGTISNVYVSENQMVGKNDGLFKLNSDSVENDIQMKQNAVTSAQKDLDDANTAAGKDTIVSPVDGIVAELSVKNGASVTSATTVATIIDPNTMETVVSVDETDISKVKVGQKANITLDAVSGKTFAGTVAQVDPIGTSSNGVTNFSVTVTIDNPDGIQIGMNANVAIVIESKENVVVLPSSALLNKKGDTAYVLSPDSLFDSKGNSVKLSNASTAALIQKYGKQISIGLANSDSVEVTSGLSSGDKVAVAITTSKSAIASLSNTTTNNRSSFGNFGSMGGSYSSTNRNRTSANTGTGNSANNNNTGTANNTGNAAAGGSAGSGNSGNKSNTNGGTGN